MTTTTTTTITTMESSTNEEAIIRCCDACGKPPNPKTKKLLNCSRCKQVWYHDRTCQKNHYKQHKKVCKPFVVIAAAAAAAAPTSPNPPNGAAVSSTSTTAAPVVTSTNKNNENNDKQNDDINTSSSSSYSNSNSNNLLLFCGIRVLESDSALGRVGVATQDFAPGDFVLKESPALIFDDWNGYFGLWDAFLDASPTTQQEILTMQSVDLLLVVGGGEEEENTTTTTNSNTLGVSIPFFKTELQRYYNDDDNNNNNNSKQRKRRRSLMNEQLASKLVSIAVLNGHSFFAEGVGSSYEGGRRGGGGGQEEEDEKNDYNNHHADGSPKSAFFITGSKLEHSCRPNLSFDVTSKGILEYSAEHHLVKDERLCISYLSCIYEECRQQRREYLMESKQFVCQCTRCMGYDECSPYNCCSIKNGGCNSKGTVFQRGGGGGELDDDETVFTCLACNWQGKVPEVQAKTIDTLSQKLNGIKTRLESTGFRPDMVKECCIIQNLIALNCSSPLHFLHPKAWHSIRVVSTSYARMLIKHMGHRPTGGAGIVESMLRLSAKCQLEHFFWVKRIVSILHGSGGDDDRSPSVQLKDVCQELSKSNSKTKVDVLKETSYLGSPGKKAMDKFLHQLVMVQASSSSKTATPTTSSSALIMAPILFHAGLDLLAAGHTTQVAKLFESYQELLFRWKSLEADNRERIELLIRTKGKQNQFPNHLLG